MKVYEYGAMSSKYQLEAEEDLNAYASMIFHYGEKASLLVIYLPEDAEQWTSFDGKVMDRLNEIFKGSFDKFVGENISSIKKCMKTIKQIV